MYVYIYTYIHIYICIITCKYLVILFSPANILSKIILLFTGEWFRLVVKFGEVQKSLHPTHHFPDAKPDGSTSFRKRPKAVGGWKSTCQLLSFLSGKKRGLSQTNTTKNTNLKKTTPKQNLTRTTFGVIFCGFLSFFLRSPNCCCCMCSEYCCCWTSCKERSNSCL